MKIYFMSCTPAMLKLNGGYAGVADGFERQTELPLNGRVMAELVPGGDFLPVAFFVEEGLFRSPPEYMDVYLSQNEAFIYIKRYPVRTGALQVIYQTRFCGGLVTLFSQGEAYLTVEGTGYCMHRLGALFGGVRGEERELNGRPVLALYSGDNVFLISPSGQLIFSGAGYGPEYGKTFKITVPFKTCAAAEARCEYSFDGRELTLVSSVTRERCAVPQEAMHFAFFESVMVRGDYVKYLTPQMAQNAKKIGGYLGAYRGVLVPAGGFCGRHGGLNAAGLLYPVRENAFEIKYYAAELKDGKIDNIFFVE